MAVLVAGMLLFAAQTVSLTQFESDPDEVTTVAAEAGVDPTELQGALHTVGEKDPRRYLIRTGELRDPNQPVVPKPAPQAAVASATPYGVWDRLAECESSGIWSNASNPKYKGGLQMDATFWANYGGLAYAPAPHMASREAQIQVAIRGQRVQGWGAWPVCSRRIGLR